MTDAQAHASPRDRAFSCVRGLVTVAVAAASVGILLWIAPPAKVIAQIAGMNPAWVLIAVALEALSCLGYVVAFRRFFPEPPRKISRQVAWIAMGAGAVLPGGNISSAATAGWLLRNHGVCTRRLLERCAAMLCFLTAFGFVLNGVIAALLLARVPGGPHDLTHTGLPILVSVGMLSGSALVVTGAHRMGAGAPRIVRGVAAGLQGAWREALAPHWRLLGVAGYMCFDIGALWAACAGTRHPLGFPAVVIAYCIGYLTTIIPMPAGLGVLDSGLAGSLVLYGFSPAASVGAVLVYRAISIWIPGAGGLIAWLPARRRGAGEAEGDGGSGPAMTAHHAVAATAPAKAT